MTMAKGMANGLLRANCMTTSGSRGYLLPERGMTISTFGGNPVSMAACPIDHRGDRHGGCRDAYPTARRVCLRSAAGDPGAFSRECGDVRGMGLMQAMELVVDETQVTAPLRRA